MNNPVLLVTGNARASAAKSTSSPVANRGAVDVQPQGTAATENHHIQQQMQTGANSTLEGNNQNVTVSVARPDRDFYLDMVVYRAGSDNSAEGTVRTKVLPGESLEAGRQYWVRVSRNLMRYESSSVEGRGKMSLEQKAVRFERELKLWLSASTKSDVVIPPLALSGELATLSLNADPNWSQDLKFTVPDDHPTAEVTLELYCCEADANVIRSAATLKVPVHGNTDPLPTPMAHYLPADAEPPAHTAILHILPAAEQQLQLIGWVRDRVDRPLEIDPIDRVRPSEVAQGADYLAELWDAVHDFAIDSPANISVWLDEVMDLYGDQCCLIIVDQADAQIPWEMFRLKDGRHLGERALIVRWTEAQYRGEESVTLQLRNARYSGRLAAFVSPDDAAPKILTQLVPKLCKSPADIENSLLVSENVPPVGIIYFGTHSVLCYGDEREALQELTSATEQTIRVRFNRIGGRLKRRTLFFANAPYSGRVLLLNGKPCGLARAALTQVANGYIGALGPIDQKISIYIAEHFLHEAQQGAQPAQLLRKLRVEAAANLMKPYDTAELREEAERQFLYTFTYVYYGNPWAHFQISDVMAPVTQESASGKTS